VYGEGLLDIGADFGQVKMVTAGSASHYTVNDSSSLHLMMTIDFFMNRSAMKKIFLLRFPLHGSGEQEKKPSNICTRSESTR
jgi:hypothetical protein